MSKVEVNELSPKTGNDVAISSGKTISGTASQFKMTDLVAGDVLYASADDTLARLAKGTASQVLTMNSGATAPEWAAAAGYDNTPSFGVSLSGNQTISNNTHVKVELDTESWDTDTAFDSTTNYRFTVPSGEGGKYVFHFACSMEGLEGNDNGGPEYLRILLYKNGSANEKGVATEWSSGNQKQVWPNGSCVMELAATDYVELYAKTNDDENNRDLIASYTFFAGWKLANV